MLNNKKRSFLLMVTMGFCIGLPTFSFAEASPGAVLSETVGAEYTETIVAEILEIDAEYRDLKLQIGDDQLSITAGEEVRNFDQLAVGDMIAVSVIRSVAVHAQTNDGVPIMTDIAGVSTSPLGEKPGMQGVETIVITADIVDIDVKNNLVTLKGPAGNLQQVPLASGTNFIDTIQVGDQAVFEMTEAIAVAIEPSK